MKSFFQLGIAVALLWDLVLLVLSWGNALLVFIGILTFLVTVGGLVINLEEGEDLKLKWMLYYSLPMVLLGSASLLRHGEWINSVIIEFGYHPLDPALPGHSLDYEAAFYAMCFSFFIPILVCILGMLCLVLSQATRCIIERFR